MKIYSFLNMVVLINGVELTGWPEGDDVIKVSRLTDGASHQTGCAGEMMVSISADKSGEFTFKLQQTSSSNKYLQQLLARQEGGPSTFTPVDVLAQDTYRQDLATGSRGYIKKHPDMTRGAKAGVQEWTIVAERLDFIFGSVDF